MPIMTDEPSSSFLAESLIPGFQSVRMGWGGNAFTTSIVEKIEISYIPDPS